MKKTLILFIFFTFICNNYCLADDYIENEIYEDSNFSEVYSISNTEPVINSKNAIVIDRKTNYVSNIPTSLKNIICII